LMCENLRFTDRLLLGFHDPAQRKHRDGRDRRGNRSSIEDLTRSPARADKRTGKQRAHDSTDAADAEARADARRTQMRWVVDGGERVHRSLSSDNAEAG